MSEMNLGTGFAPSSIEQQSSARPSRRSGVDRRSQGDRRRTGGLLDARTRRNTTRFDRRRGERRERQRSWLSFLRRFG